MRKKRRICYQPSSMAIVQESEALPSSSTPSPSPYTYHAFLSFRGKDVRYDIADWLYTELDRAGINTFRDVDEIEIGKDIDVEIEKAIRESKVAVVLFSDGFASSTYCLDEVAMFMERRRRKEVEVLAVFYKVDPSDVSEQKGSYGAAFAEHEEKLRLLQGEELQNEKQRLQRHKAALQQVAEVAAYVYNHGYLSSFIEKVVEDVSRLVNRSPLYVPSRLVGIHSLVEDINRWVQDESNLVPIGLIYGPSGIGKKTIAKVIYNDNYKNFDCGIFLANVGETMKQFNGIVHLQRQLLSNIRRGKRTSEFFSEDEGIVMIREAISNKRVLIVLTGVDQLNQFYDILREPQWLKQGSRIIITSKNEDLLESRSCMKFGVKPLGYIDSRELLCWHAFGRTYPVEEYWDHVMTALPYCCGFPLAIEALGSTLNDSSPNQWEKSLRKPEDIGNDKIQKVLKIIFDSMEVRDKNLFLDIAVFYIGKDKEYVDAVIEACGYYYEDGIERLLRINLVTIDEYNRVMMLQPIRDFGREIARQESEVTGSRHRIWCPRDACDVLRESTGTRDVWSFKLDQQHESASAAEKMNLKTEGFARMRNLKLLHLDDVNLTGGFKGFPEGLVWLYWRRFSLPCIPNTMSLEHLIVLDMRSSSLRKIWNGNQTLGNLKILNLSYSHKLVTTPDFERVHLPNLKKLLLKDCKGLVEIHPSIGVLKRLVELNLKGCISLVKLPSDVARLASLDKLDLSGCLGLLELPDFVWMKSLRVLRMNGVSVNPLCSNAREYKRLGWLSVGRSSKPIGFSFSAFVPSLVELTLENCNISDAIIPETLGVLTFLKLLDLSNNPIRTLPETINKLDSLFFLILEGCKILEHIPELPQRLKLLNACYCSSLERIEGLVPTTQLAIVGCENLVDIGGKFRLRTTQFESQMINTIDLFGHAKVNTMATRGRATTSQVLHACGRFSALRPESEIRRWYDHQTEMSCTFYDSVVPAGLKVIGINLCIEYGAGPLEGSLLHSSFSIFLRSKTKYLSWSYHLEAIEGCNADVPLRLSHWSLPNQLEGGDSLRVCLISPNNFKAKINLGVCFACGKEEEEGSQTISSASPWYQTFADAHMWSPQESGTSTGDLASS